MINQNLDFFIVLVNSSISNNTVLVFFWSFDELGIVQ